MCLSVCLSDLSQQFLLDSTQDRHLISHHWICFKGMCHSAPPPPMIGWENAWPPEKLDLAMSRHQPLTTALSNLCLLPPLQMLIALLSSGLALLGALVCFVTSGVALKEGPFCMFDVSSFNQTQAWKFGYPFKDLPNR